MIAHDAHDDGSRSFLEGLFRILGLRFCPVRQEGTKPAARAAHPSRTRRIAAIAETGGEERSTKIDPGISSGGSIEPSLSYSVGTASLSRRSDPPR